MKITLQTGYNNTHGFISISPETSAEHAQYREILAIAKKSRLKYHQYDDGWGNWGLSFHIPFLPEQTDYQI